MQVTSGATFERPNGTEWRKLSVSLDETDFNLMCREQDIEPFGVALKDKYKMLQKTLVLPSSPAAVGVFEWATVVALQAYGVADSEALSYALVAHALNFVPFIVAGVLILHREALPRRR